ncbi:MAG: ABC transporter permease [Pseudomonadota bacterium]
MNITTLTVTQLLPAFVPVVLVVVIMWYWGQGYGRALYAICRMLLQLTLIGYFLVYIFESDSSLVVSGVLAVMVLAASYIALNTVDLKKSFLLPASLLSVVIGGGLTLVLITQGVLQLRPWYQASFVIPLAGMIFSASMTNISLALERIWAELDTGKTYEQARDIAFRAAMIPVINSFFAVGLISLPGMMTGQILSGVSPMVASRYQIVVMCMIFGAAGISTAIFLTTIRHPLLLHRADIGVDSK